MSAPLTWADLPAAEAERLRQLQRIKRGSQALYRRARRIADHCLSGKAQCLAGELQELSAWACVSLDDEEAQIHGQAERDRQVRRERFAEEQRKGYGPW